MGTVLVAQMSTVGKNAHFDRIGTAGLHQHSHIVIAFHHVIVRIGDQRHAFLPDISGIGNVHQLFLRRFQNEANGIFSIVGQRQRRHSEIAHLKWRIGLDPVLIRTVFQTKAA